MSDTETKENMRENEEGGQDKFSQMMFGTRRIAKSESKPPAQPSLQDNEGSFDHIVSQIDDIYTSIQNLKPIINEFSPIIDFLKKKI